MAYDAVRAQLDKLLGPDRNGPINPSNAKKTPHYTDESVCKHFLLGFCPNDLHIKHRSEPGSCPNLHSEAAKAAFEKDEAAGKLRNERVRWTRDLLRECRSILYDEDRKIRGHARRLQETYAAKGDLAGLMIRNFDTLKKLGMVRKDAKIRILSEIDDLDDADDTQDNHNDDTTATPQNADTKTASASAKDQPAKGSGVAKKEAGSDDDDDDDMEGFGIVKVIPASGNGGGSQKTEKGDSSVKVDHEEVDEFGRIKVKKPDEKQNKPEDQNKQTASALNDGSDDDDDDDDDGGFGLIKIIPANHNRDDSSDEEEDRKPSPSTPEKTQNGSNHNPQNKEKGDVSTEKGANDDKQSQKEEKKTDSERGDKTAPAEDKKGSDGTESNDVDTQPEDGKEADSESLTPEQIMEKFYEAGKGPDGLLMLDKKQSLRVCQCCGGYISLVDAESRLLSHYGGKSHHSLAQLRAKVPELEEYLSKQPSHLDDDHSRSGPRHWSERDRDRPHRDDDRHRPGGYYERRAGRSRGDAEDGRGYGTTTWYSGPGRTDEAQRDYGRRNDDRFRSGDRYRGGNERQGRGDDRYSLGDDRYRHDDDRRDSGYREGYRNDGRHDDRHRGERYRDDRHRDSGRYRGDRYAGSDDRYRAEDGGYSRENRYRDERYAEERHYDRSHDRDWGRYGSGRKRQRSPSPQRRNRRTRR